MFLEEFFGLIEYLALLGGLADYGDLGWLDRRGLVAEAVADVGEDRRCFGIIKHAAEGSHRDVAGVFLAVKFEGAHETMEGEFDEAVGIAVNPGAVGEWRERGVDAFSIGLVANGAMGVAVIDFMTGGKLFFACLVEVARDGREGVFVHLGLSFSCEAGCGGFGRVFGPRVKRLASGEGDGFFADGIVEPRAGDDGLKPDAAVGIRGGCGEQSGVVGDAVGVVTQDADGCRADLEIFRLEELAEEGIVNRV